MSANTNNSSMNNASPRLYSKNRSENDDNWRLSMDRARAAFFMLKRAGFTETRISQITGFADRKLRVPEDPYDDSNRRIELLLEIEQ